MTSVSASCLALISIVSTSIAPCFCADRGVDTERLKLIPARLQEAVAGGVISGAVTLVAHGGKIVELDAAGWSDRENDKRMRTDTTVQIIGHGGAFGTDGWVDPRKHLIVILLGQMLDGSADPLKNAVGQIAEAAMR